MKKRIGWAAIAVALSACGGEGALREAVEETAPRYEWRVERDEWGVPTAIGARDADAAYAFAQAHAEDDFANIQSFVFAAAGMAGRLQGKAGAASDYFHALLKVDERLEAYDEAVPADVRAVLEGYAAGLNAYALDHPEERKVGPWPVTGRTVAAGFILTSPLFYGLNDEVGRLAAGGYDPCTPKKPLELADAFSAPAPNGSNAFAVSPRGSDDGATRLIVNSHQPFEGPLAWYEARIRSEEGWNLGGGTFSGAPFPLVGYNETLAFGATVNRPDLVDHYALVVEKGRKNQYFFDGEWRDFEKRRVKLRVRFGPIIIPATRTIRYSVHGPVYDTPSGPVAVSFATGGIKGAEAFFRLGKARSIDEFLDALKVRGIASFNYVAADADGRIAFVYNGSLPRRGGGWDGDGCAPGDDPAYLWGETLPLSANPQVIDPPSGWVYSANATPFSATDPDDDLDPADYPSSLGVEPASKRTNRSLRAVETLAAAAPISREELEAAKFDITYSENYGIRDMVREIVALAQEGDPEIAAIADVLREWDFRIDRESRAALLATTLYSPFGTADYYDYPRPDFVTTIKDRAAEVRARFGRLDPVYGEVVRHRRGDFDAPIDGGPDVLRAIRFAPDEDGLLKTVHGDGFMAFVEWDADGRQTVRTIHQYGAAKERPGDRHFADQAPLYVDEAWRDAPAPAEGG